MSTVRERAGENVTGITSMLILGLGFVGLFADFQYFFVVWIIGFAVVLPIVSMLSGEDDESTPEKPDHGTRGPAEDAETEARSTTDALATLRERYARGDLTDEQFERKLDRLFETETPEAAAEWRSRERERIDERS